MALLKQCSKSGCRELVEKPERYCELHRNDTAVHTYNRNRYKFDSEAITFYHSTKWKKKRIQALKRDDYLCQDCLDKGIITIADVVDHIVELKDDWNKRLDINNLRSLCNACHNTKTANERNRRNQRDS